VLIGVVACVRMPGGTQSDTRSNKDTCRRAVRVYESAVSNARRPPPIPGDSPQSLASLNMRLGGGSLGGKVVLEVHVLH
jgi:hypothetical protein